MSIAALLTGSVSVTSKAVMIDGISYDARFNSADKWSAMVQFDSTYLDKTEVVIPSEIEWWTMPEGYIVESETEGAVWTRIPVTSMSEGSFNGCTKLEHIKIPGGLQYVCQFFDCSSLTADGIEVDGPNDCIWKTEDGCVYGRQRDKIIPILLPQTVLEEYVIPNYVDMVGLYGLFPKAKKIVVPHDCKAKIYFPKTNDYIEEIELNGPSKCLYYKPNFRNYTKLRKVVFPSDYTEHPVDIFLYRWDERKVIVYTHWYYYYEFTESIEEIVFSKLRDFNDLVVEAVRGEWTENIPSTGCSEYAFMPASLKKIVITDTDTIPCKLQISDYMNQLEIELHKPIKKYVDKAFEMSKNITMVRFAPEAELYDGMFNGCSKLRTLTVPMSGLGANGHLGSLFGQRENDGMRPVVQLTETGSTKYFISPVIENVELAEGCAWIAFGALSNMSTLKTLTLPSTLTMLGEKALYGCSALTDIYCHSAEPPAAFDNTFDGMRFTSCRLHVPAGTAEIYKRSPGWERFYHIEEESPIDITIWKNIENAGVVYGINKYQVGDIATFEAAANTGYTFKGWYEADECIGTDPKIEIIVSRAMNIEARFNSVNDAGQVEAVVDGTDLTVTLEPVSDAETYTLDVYSDANMTWLIDSQVFDRDGKRKAAGSTSDIELEITNLNPNSTFYYCVSAKDNSGAVLEQYSGQIKTGVAALKDITYDTDTCIDVRVDGNTLDVIAPTPQKIMLFSLSGTILYDDVTESFSRELTSGIYVLRIGSIARKIAIR